MFSKEIIRKPFAVLTNYVQTINCRCLKMELRSKGTLRNISKREQKHFNSEPDDTNPKVNLSAFKIQKKQKLSKRTVTKTALTETYTKEEDPNAKLIKTKRGNNPNILKTETNSSEVNIVPNAEIKREHIKVEYDEENPSPSKRKYQQYQCKAETEKYESNDKMPLNWETVLYNLREMRKDFDAPVDSMGCNKCHDEKASPKVKNYQCQVYL